MTFLLQSCFSQVTLITQSSSWSLWHVISQGLKVMFMFQVGSYKQLSCEMWKSSAWLNFSKRQNSRLCQASTGQTKGHKAEVTVKTGHQRSQGLCQGDNFLNLTVQQNPCPLLTCISLKAKLYRQADERFISPDPYLALLQVQTNLRGQFWLVYLVSPCPESWPGRNMVYDLVLLNQFKYVSQDKTDHSAV